MPKIALVGCGFLGSIFLDEFLKRRMAGKMTDDFVLIDFDHVDDRNPANQNFDLEDIGDAKAVCLARRAQWFKAEAENIVDRIDENKVDSYLGGCRLVVDCVDNLPTRQLLWEHAYRTRIPTLHAGLTEMGTGMIEWSHPEHDTFSLSPVRLAGKPTPKEPESGVDPPCELIRMRGVGLLTGLMAATAASIYLGFDPDSFLDKRNPFGWMTEWDTTVRGFTPREMTWARIDPLDQRDLVEAAREVA